MSRKSALLLLGALFGLGLGSTAQGAPQTLEIDAVHSTVLFKIKHMNVGYNFGRFNELSGKVHFDADQPEQSSLEITIKTASVDTANAKRDQHLRGPDFFDAKQFPVMTFKSQSVKKTGDNTYSMTGELMAKGVKKTITVPVEHTGTGQGRGGKTLVGALSTFKIKRSDYGIDYMLGGLSDEVELIVSIEAAQK
jgi:polyisoprenoid-binding protein YceI